MLMAQSHSKGRWDTQSDTLPASTRNYLEIIMKRIETLIWGSVRSNSKKYYLLKEEPESPWQNPKWQLEDTLRWLVADVDSLFVPNDSRRGVYKASYLIFGKNASLELLDDPTTEILVDYYTSEDEDVVANPI